MSSVFGNIYRKEKVTRKKLKRLRKEKKARFLQEKAVELQKNTPASEIWFYGKFSLESIPRILGSDFKDQKNVPFHNLYIPDILNEGYRYVIEVDGSIHETQAQAYKDFSKDNSYRLRGFKCFRVKAYNEESYNKFIIEFKDYINTCHNTFLLGIYSIHTTYGPLPLFVNKQKQMIKKYLKLTKIQNVIPITGKVPETKVKTIIRKPVTILRKAT